MTPEVPPAYAWDWFTRQRLLWQEARARLARGAGPAAVVYGGLETRPEVVARLREDYPEDPSVRAAVDEVVREVAFLDRTGRPFEEVASRTAPRGLRWWWHHLSGDDVPPPPPRPAARDSIPETQLTIGEVLTGYGDDRSGGTGRDVPTGASGPE